MKKFSEFIIRKGLSRTGVKGGEVVLSKQDCVKAINIAEKDQILILGGDCYKFSNNEFITTNDNFYIELNAGTSRQELCLKGCITARNFISLFPDDYWFVLVVDEN